MASTPPRRSALVLCLIAHAEQYSITSFCSQHVHHIKGCPACEPRIPARSNTIAYLWASLPRVNSPCVQYDAAHPTSPSTEVNNRAPSEPQPLGVR